ARQVRRREARHGAPAGRLVATAPSPVDARLRGGGHRAPAPAARRLAGAAGSPRAVGLGGGGVPAARGPALDRDRRRSGRLSAGEGSEGPAAAPARRAARAVPLARDPVAAELGLDPGVLCGRPTLEAVARAVTSPNDRAGLAQIGEIRRWQIQVLGDALLAALG